MNITDARFQLNGLLLESVFAKREEFTERVCMHYLAMLQHQMFKVCVCVREREREREYGWVWELVCVCMCVTHTLNTHL